MGSLTTNIPFGTTLADWDVAYVRVEAYFIALGLKNKLLLSRLVSEVLSAAAQCEGIGRTKSTVAAAVDETEMRVANWFREVLALPAEPTASLLRRGRLALLLLPDNYSWESEFLTRAPWSPPFVEQMRRNYLDVGPSFNGSLMVARNLDFGPVSTLAEGGLRQLDRHPRLRIALGWMLLIGLASFIFFAAR